MNRRILLSALLALSCLPAAAQPAMGGRVALYQGGTRTSLSIDPATLGNRASWDEYGDGQLSFQFTATGPEGEWILGMSVDRSRPTGGTMIPPQGVAAAISDPEIALQRVRVRGFDLEVSGHIADPATGRRIEFSVTLPQIDFAPTPGPDMGSPGH